MKRGSVEGILRLFGFADKDVHIGEGVQRLVGLVAALIALRDLGHMDVIDLRRFNLEGRYAVRLGLLEGAGGFITELHDHALDGVAFRIVDDDAVFAAFVFRGAGRGRVIDGIAGQQLLNGRLVIFHGRAFDREGKDPAFAVHEQGEGEVFDLIKDRVIFRHPYVGIGDAVVREHFAGHFRRTLRGVPLVFDADDPVESFAGKKSLARQGDG